MQAASVPSTLAITSSSVDRWNDFWSNNGFLDVLTGTPDPRAEELQRRIILNRYHMRVNEAGDLPPQEVSQLRMIFGTFRIFIVDDILVRIDEQWMGQ